MIAVDGQPAIPVTFAQGGDLPGFIANMQGAINARLAAAGMTGSVTVDLPTLIPGTRQLQVTSNGGSVIISTAQQNDVAVALQLGVANGGIEISSWSRIRPAPTGIVARLNINPDDLARFGVFAATDQNAIGPWSLNDPDAGPTYTQNPFAGAPGQPMYVGTSFVPAAGDTALGSLLNVRQHLGVLAASIANNSNNRFAFSLQGLRLALVPRFEGSDAGFASSLTGANISGGGEMFEPPPGAIGASNVRAYTVGQPGGAIGLGPFQGGSVAGSDGGHPAPGNYQTSFAVIDREVDIFNLMVLPRALGQPDNDRAQL